MQICKRCVLDNYFPGIRFDENGICNFCYSQKMDQYQALKEKYEKKFKDLIQKNKGKGTYDCLVAFSGGKDSTYTLQLMKNKYKLNILAFTFNNWFQSERSHQNIQNVLMHINVDHLTVIPNLEAFRKIIHACISQDLYSIKTLQRATTICTTCLSMIRFIGFKIAIEKEIPFVILGMSPGQAPIVTSVFKTNAEMVRRMQDVIFQGLYKRVGDIIKPYFLEEKHFEQEDNFPYSINPLVFSDYSEENMIAVAQGLGWTMPDDTDANSTNCLLNAFANQIHIEKFNFHPYAFEIAELVRMGCLSREEGINRIKKPQDEKIVKQVKEKIVSDGFFKYQK